MELPITFMGLLTVIGSPVFIGIIISVILVRMTWFVDLNKPKFWIVGAICIGLPIISRLLILYLPLTVVDFLEFWWPTVVTGMGVWTSSQIWNIFFGEKGILQKAKTPAQINAPN
jgi:hypothetical protein